MSYKKTPSAIKFHGGKNYLADRIIELMPPHIHYVEPYFGSGAVLFAKNPEGVSEVVNDLNSQLTVFWTVLQNPIEFTAFKRLCGATPFSEFEWDLSKSLCENDHLFDLSKVDKAHAFFVFCRQSMAGRMKSFAPLTRTRVRRGMSEQASAWLSAVEGLEDVHKRLSRVVILNRLAIDVITGQDGEATLHYLDPPYIQSSRASKDSYGDYEMTEESHKELLDTIKHCKGKVILSGYANPMYNEALASWNRHDVKLPNSAASGEKKRMMTESLWLNY